MPAMTDLGVQLIKSFERCKLKAYPDPGTGGEPWTIGWGSTGPGITEGIIWTQGQADNRLDGDIKSRVVAVANVTRGANLNDNQFSALLSFAYNVGSWRSSTLIKLVCASKFAEASDQFPLWCHSGKKVLQGLLDRRNCERLLFLGDIPGVSSILKARG